MDSRSPVDGAQGNQGVPPPPPGPGIQQQQHPQQPHQPNPHEPAPQAPAPQGQWPQTAPPPPGGPGLPGQASRQPNPKRRKGLIIAGSVAAGLLVILGVGGFFGYKHLSETTYSPRVQAEEYLQALVDGNAEKALSMAPVESDDEVDTSLMTNEAFEAAENRLSGFEVTEVAVDGDTATVTADIRQGEESESMTLELSKAGTEAVFFNKWKLDGPLDTWTVDYLVGGDVTELTVNGVTVPVKPEGKLAVFPGDYTFKAPEGDKFIRYGDDITVSTGLITGEESGVTEMSVLYFPLLTDAVRPEIEAQTAAHLDKCMQSTVLVTPGCPNKMEEEDPNNVRNIKWSMPKAPTYDEIDGDPLAPFRVVARDGEITLNAELKVGEDWEPVEAKGVLYEIPAIVTIQDGKLTMEFPE
ncbi:hypothetical protein [Arthrobacter sp. zg-Y179]|uniref:hypothetical protein n=1 Tax=Arthrobacter sp. zg-Y179 TaxID=2894188 RepID=UPI001E3E1EA9|nr:hypothetical protein [Arthrobacter sp. zg-Y179]MCC9174021.1 hypothetical protein [Arthrobacter sp. zg-Y179]